ncbi:MAG: lysophospholipid acyltransferase family protein [Deferrisomatales bacterium]
MGDAALRVVVRLGRGYLRILQATCRFRQQGAEDGLSEARAEGAVLWAFWHNRLLGPLVPYRDQKAGVVISQSRDGELIARVVEGFGYVALRGSSSRGGSQALRALLRHLRSGRDVAFTPDGPRGPRYTVRPGLAYLAARTGRPVVPLGVAYSRKAVFSSWDRFQVPLPFSTVLLQVAQPLFFPTDAPEAAASEEIRVALAAATEAAEESLGVRSP